VIGKDETGDGLPPLDVKKAKVMAQARAALDMGLVDEDVAAFMNRLTPEEQEAVRAMEPQDLSALEAEIDKYDTGDDADEPPVELDYDSRDSLPEEPAAEPNWRTQMTPEPAVETSDPRFAQNEANVAEFQRRGMIGGDGPLRRPSQAEAMSMGIGQGFTFGFADDMIDTDLAVESEKYQPEALTLGELMGGFGLGGALRKLAGPLINSSRTALRGANPSLLRSASTEAVLGGATGMAEDALSRAGHAEGGIGERLDAAKGAVPGLGDEEDPMPLGFMLGTAQGAASGGGRYAQEQLRADPKLGGPLRNLEARGGSTDLLRVAKPPPDVDMSPRPVERTGFSLDEYISSIDGEAPSASKVPQRYQDAETATAGNVADKYLAEAADTEKTVFKALESETAQALQNAATQRAAAPINLTRTLVQSLSEAGRNTPFAEGTVAREALRRLVTRVEPAENYGTLREIAPGDLDESSMIEVSKGQLRAMGLDDLIPKKSVRPPSMPPSAADPGVGQDALGTPLKPRGYSAMGEPYWDEPRPATPSGRPPASQEVDADDVGKYRLVIAPKNAAELDVITGLIDDKVNWKTPDSSEDFTRYAAAVRQDRAAYGEDWAALKEKHSQVLSALEEARTGVGLSPKEKFDPRSRVQRDRIASAIEKYDGSPAQDAALALARSPDVRKAFMDIGTMSDVRKLTNGSQLSVTRSGPPTLGSIDSWRLRLDPSMGSLANETMGSAVQNVPVALTLRDMEAHGFEGGPKELVNEALRAYVQEQERKKLEQQLQAETNSRRAQQPPPEDELY